MAILQRLILVVGVLAALAVTFIWPPKVVYGSGGGRFSTAACVLGNGEMDTECLNLATIDGGVLATRLGVIVLATLALAYASRPTVASRSAREASPESAQVRRTTDESAPQ